MLTGLHCLSDMSSRCVSAQPDAEGILLSHVLGVFACAVASLT